MHADTGCNSHQRAKREAHQNFSPTFERLLYTPHQFEPNSNATGPQAWLFIRDKTTLQRPLTLRACCAPLRWHPQCCRSSSNEGPGSQDAIIGGCVKSEALGRTEATLTRSSRRIPQRQSPCTTPSLSFLFPPPTSKIGCQRLSLISVSFLLFIFTFFYFPTRK